MPNRWPAARALQHPHTSPLRNGSQLAARLAALLAASLANGCGGQPPAALQQDVVHDLYALFGSAEVTSGGRTEHPPLALFRLVYLDNKVDDRDQIATLAAPAPTSITWSGLATSGPARLQFGTGIVQLEAGPWRPVVFRVEARDELSAETGFRTVFEEQLDRAQLGGPDDIRRHELELASAGAARWTLRFSTEGVPLTQGSIAWPGWFEPTLRSLGRRVPLSEAPVRQRVIVQNLVSTLDQAEVLQQRDDDPVAASAFDAAEDVPVFGGRRSLVAASAPARVRWRLAVPPAAELAFAVGMDTERGWKLPGDGMRFLVRIDGTEVWSLDLDGHHELADRGWHQVQLDLSPWSGRQVALELLTETRADGAHDVGGFANPCIVARRDTPRLAAGSRPNVLVLVMDTLRADGFGVQGNRNDLTPRMDALAAAGVRFAQARAVASYTWPSTASLLTGLYPHAHGVLGNAQAWLVDGVDTLAELFASAGYTTGAFVANPLIGPAGNFQQGFESFVNAPAVRARALNERVALWLDGREQAALFAYVHYFDPHNPYNAPPGFEPGVDVLPAYTQEPAASLPHLQRVFPDVTWDAEQLRSFHLQNNGNRRDYDGEVRYIDTAVGELLDEFERRGLLQDALVLLVADHGEEFFEHGYPFHGPNLYEESVRVPMVLAGFGRSALPPAVADHPVQLIDVLPTLCELTGVPLPEAPLHGVSMLSGPHDAPHFLLSMNGEEVGVSGMTQKLAVFAPPWKLIHTPASRRVELYRLDQDPGELHDLSEQEPDVRRRLERLLDDWVSEALRQVSDDTGISPEQQWWLDQLGYVERER